MPPLAGEHCENCLKHLSKGHLDGQNCDKCLPTDGVLQRCKGCQTVRYCTKLCQTEHWKTHKPICRLTVNLRQHAESAGVSERKEALQAWVYKNAQIMAGVGVTALGLHSDRERAETNVFVVYLDFVESTPIDAPRRPRTNYSIRGACCVPLEEVHRRFARRFAGGSATLTRDLTPKPRVLKVLVIDDGLPPPVDMFSSPVVIGEDMSRFQNLGSNWLVAFKQIAK